MNIEPGCWQAPALALLMLAATSCSANAQTFDAHDPHSPLRLVRSIALPEVRGRIDHLAFDPKSDHLFVAEIANGTVDDVDLASGKAVGRISGLTEPQGVAWLPNQDEIAVACGDGSVHFYRRDRQEIARISLGEDADNVRVDGRNGNLVVGYGTGALAVIDPATHRVIRQLALPAHPEAFEVVGSRVFVNVPVSHKIVIGDLDRAKVIATLSTGMHFGNYPMASDAKGSRVAIAFRFPGTLSVTDARSTATVFSSSICGDADDVYFHGQQIVVVCGEGAVQLISETPEHSSVRVATSRGARTGLLDRDRNELFVAVPAGTEQAAIWQLSFAEVRRSR
jgi:DNA-binding beta-propeller fold protein YncE